MNNYLFWKRFAQGKLKTHVSSVKIRIPSPREILSWSERRLPNSTLVGKIDNAHTVEHDTLRPVSGGLFCERIFGPIATNVCACLRRKGWNEDYCKICEVQFTKSRLRRYQMGHIVLAAPVIHIWALQGGYLANLLGKKNLGIRSIVYGKVMSQSKLWKPHKEIAFGEEVKYPTTNFVQATTMIEDKGGPGACLAPLILPAPKAAKPVRPQVVDTMEYKGLLSNKSTSYQKVASGYAPAKQENKPHHKGKEKQSTLKTKLFEKPFYFRNGNPFNSKLGIVHSCVNKKTISSRGSVSGKVKNQTQKVYERGNVLPFHQFVLYKPDTFNKITQFFNSLEKGQPTTPRAFHRSVARAKGKSPTRPVFGITRNQRFTEDNEIVLPLPHYSKQKLVVLQSKTIRYTSSLNTPRPNFLQSTRSTQSTSVALSTQSTSVALSTLKERAAKSKHKNFLILQPTERSIQPNQKDTIRDFGVFSRSDTLYWGIFYDNYDSYFLASLAQGSYVSAKQEDSAARKDLPSLMVNPFVQIHFKNSESKKQFRSTEGKIFDFFSRYKTNRHISFLNGSFTRSKVTLGIPSQSKSFHVPRFAPTTVSKIPQEKVNHLTASGGSEARNVETLPVNLVLPPVAILRSKQCLSRPSKATSVLRIRRLVVFDPCLAIHPLVSHPEVRQSRKVKLIPLDRIFNKVIAYERNKFNHVIAIQDRGSYLRLTSDMPLGDYFPLSRRHFNSALTKHGIESPLPAVQKLVSLTHQKLEINLNRAAISKTMVKLPYVKETRLSSKFNFSKFKAFTSQAKTPCRSSTSTPKFLQSTSVARNRRSSKVGRLGSLGSQGVGASTYGRAEPEASKGTPSLMPSATSFARRTNSNSTLRLSTYGRAELELSKGINNVTKKLNKAKLVEKIDARSLTYLKKVKRNKPSLIDIKNIAYTGSSVLFQSLKNLNLVLLYSLINWKWKKSKIELNKFLLQDKLTKKKRNLRNKIAKTKIILNKRKNLVQSFLNTSQLPEWMVISILPVLPPALRPILELEPNNVVVSDLNVLYQTVIRRNDALMGLLSFRALEIDILNRQVSLQQAIEKLFDKGAGTKKRPVKSLSQGFHGKKGLFRSHLLGKRVDYSGRSVIVVGPQLKLHECGLPKEMALVLFLPFLIARLKKRKVVANTSQAKQLILHKDKQIWSHLKSLIYEHPVLLNRAPTLHRLGFQAFQPILVSGKAMILPALVCTGFNADFDGDQMAVHIPLSHVARAESWKLLHAKNNMLSPATGKPIVVLSQEMILGCYCSSLILNFTHSYQKSSSYLHDDSRRQFNKSKICHKVDVPAKSAEGSYAHPVTLFHIGSRVEQSKKRPPKIATLMHRKRYETVGSKTSYACKTTIENKSYLGTSIVEVPSTYDRKVAKKCFALRSASSPTYIKHKNLSSNKIAPILDLPPKLDLVKLNLLSVTKPKLRKNLYFTTFQDIYKALGTNKIAIQTAVWLRIPFFEDNQFLEEPLEIRLDAMGHSFRSYCQSQRHFSKNIKSKDQLKGISYIRTSAGRIQLNETFYSSWS